MKRIADMLGSLLGLLVLAPVMVATALVVACRMGRPVIFRQARTGVGGTPFRVYKYRTMESATDSAGRALPDRQRVTPLGRWLRRTSLDELPQLINVLRGEMSIVGPRPLPEVYLPSFTVAQSRRHSVRPGITGWAQAMGRNAVCMAEKVEMDLFYVDNRSLLMDARILLATVGVVLGGQGVTPEGYDPDKTPCASCDDTACAWATYAQVEQPRGLAQGGHHALEDN